MAFFVQLNEKFGLDLQHLSLVHEDDLLINQSHQKGLDRVFDFFGIPSVPVSAKMLKVTATDLSEIKFNYNDLVLKLKNTLNCLHLNQ